MILLFAEQPGLISLEKQHSTSLLAYIYSVVENNSVHAFNSHSVGRRTVSIPLAMLPATGAV